MDMNNVIILKQTWLEDKTPNLIKKEKDIMNTPLTFS